MYKQKKHTHTHLERMFLNYIFLYRLNSLNNFKILSQVIIFHKYLIIQYIVYDKYRLLPFSINQIACSKQNSLILNYIPFIVT
jgi:hypothetical protein